MKRSRWFLSAFAAFALFAAACGDDSDDDTAAEGDTETTAAETEDGGEAAGDLSGVINVSGSSTVEPITTRAAELFADEAPDVVINVDGPGTGDGFELFCQGETDISDASRPISDEEIADCEEAGVEYVELRVAFDGIAVMTSPDNDAVTCLTFADLYALLGPESEGFDNWSQAQPIASELGSTTEFPDLPLEVIAPGTESGTYDSFIEIVLEGIAEDDRGIEEDPFIRTDFPGQADDNVIIQGISGSTGALGWVGFAFADENRDAIKILEVDNGESGCVEPTVDTIADESYPVNRPLFIYVSLESAQRPEVRSFVDFYLTDAYEEAVTMAFGDSGYVALPTDLIDETRSEWESAMGGGSGESEDMEDETTTTEG